MGLGLIILEPFSPLHCVFSNVSSNCLPQRMQNHIGCICLFLHCVFSNAFSNFLRLRMHIRIGCIYLSFVHGKFVRFLWKLLFQHYLNHNFQRLDSSLQIKGREMYVLLSALCAESCKLRYELFLDKNPQFHIF